jgi:phage baseplate assembly protein W
MANLLKRFNTEVIGSDEKLYDYVAKINAAGDFKRVKDIDVIITSWNNILMTQRRTYLFDPEYGSDLHKIVFEPVDDTTIERIKTEVETRIRLYDDRATIEDIKVLLNKNGKGYTVNIEVEYEGETGTLSVKFDDSTVVRQDGSFAV